MGLRRKTDDLDEKFSEKEVDDLHRSVWAQTEKEMKRFVASHSNSKTKDDLWERWAQIREMLFHLHERVNYWEERRTQYLQIGIGVLAGAVAGMIAIFTSFEHVDALWPVVQATSESIFMLVKGLVFLSLFVICLVFAVGSLFLLRRWNTQNNPSYPFTKAYRTWVWHYRHAEKTKLNTDFQAYTRKTFRVQVKRYAENLVDYKKRFLESGIEELLDQDLSQLYLLLINEKFKIKMVSRLRDCFVKTVEVAITSAIISLILAVVGIIAVQICCAFPCIAG